MRPKAPTHPTQKNHKEKKSKPQNQQKTMNYIKILILVFLTTPVLFAQDNQWEQYDFLDRNFSIYFPVQPKERVGREVFNNGYMNVFHLTYSPEDINAVDSNRLYMASIIKFPKGTFQRTSKGDVENIFNELIKGGLQGVKGKLLYVKKIEHDSISGRQAKMVFTQDGEKNVSLIRYFLGEDKVYAVHTVTSPQYDNNSLIEKFMNSFAFIKRPQINLHFSKKL